MSDSDSGSHGCGCFPIRIWRKRTPARKVSIFELALIQRSRPPADVDEPSIDKVDDSPEGPPTAAQYALHATKQTITILKGVAGLAPVPLVKEVLELGLNIIETCEAINDVQSKVAVLKDRIAAFLLVIAKVTKDPDAGVDDKKAIPKLSEDFKADLLELKSCLSMITTRLDAIKDQNVILTGILSKPNLDVISDCESHFQAEVSRFQTLQGLYATQDLATIQQQLVKLYGITEEMALNVKDTQQKVHAIESSVNELVAMLSKTGTDSATILARIPRAPDVFFGRDHVVQRIAEQLTCGDSTRSRICLVGPGGMGKTSAALAIIEHNLIVQGFAQQHRFWIPCISANSPALFLALLFKHIKAERKTGDPLDDIIASLQESDHPRIVLLDNFETPWHPLEGSQSTIRLVLEALDALPHVSILVTMRSEFSPLEKWSCEKLSQINPEDSRKIYTAIDTNAENYPELDELVAALGHLPYAITLMASRGKRSFSNPRQLLKEWQEVGTSMLSRPEEGIDHSISLSIDSKFVRNSPGALHLLQILSMLPAGLYHEHLSTWAEGWHSEAIDTLRDAALVSAREVTIGDSTKIHLFVLPVVQSYMKHSGRIPKEVEQQVFAACYSFLAQKNVTADGPNDPHFNEHAKEIASQETNLQALLTGMIKDALTETGPTPVTSSSPSVVTLRELEALLSFSCYQRWVKPRPEITQQIVLLARQSGQTQHEAAAFFCLGSIHEALSEAKNASDAFTRAQLLFEQLGDDLMTLRSESIGLICKLQVVDVGEGISLVGDYYARWKERINTKPSLQAWFLAHSGYFNCVQSEHEKALADFRTAQQLFGQLDPPCKLEIAIVDGLIARAYVTRGLDGDYEAALNAINSATDAFRAIYGEGLVSQYCPDSYLIKARILKGANQWTEELDATLKIALQFHQESGHSLGVALTLMELAEIYVRREDWPAAKLAYEEVIKKCTGLDRQTSRSPVDTAQHNLKYIAHISQQDTLTDPGEKGIDIAFQQPPRY